MRLVASLRTDSRALERTSRLVRPKARGRPNRESGRPRYAKGQVGDSSLNVEGKRAGALRSLISPRVWGPGLVLATKTLAWRGCVVFADASEGAGMRACDIDARVGLWALRVTASA